MHSLIWLGVAHILWTSRALGYLGKYYHYKNITKIQPPDRLPEDSYFGFSIAYYPWTKGLIVSAPKQTNCGEVYDCSASSGQCSVLKHNISRELAEYKHDYWLGATVRAGKDFLVTCAPRYTQYKDFGHTHGTGTFIHCYSRKKNENVLHSMRLPPNEHVKQNSTSKFEQLMDSLGWSIDIDPDNTKNPKNIIIGGPAMFTGRAMEYSSIDKIPQFIYPDGYHHKEFAKHNFGYSVAVGYFVKGKVTYAIGSPYGTEGSGMVQLLKKHQGTLFAVVPSLKTDAVGSMFGAVLCAASFSGKRADLLVGAPAFATSEDLSTHNIGAVYVYIQNREQTPLYKRTIKGKKNGIRFGSAIVSVGDLNGDKIDEIAIAAPYEDNGVVYLYSGSDLLSKKTEQELTELQRIPSPGPYRPFGLSLTALRDYDDNGCNELAIGAPYNDTVVLLKCFAAITVNTLKADFSDLLNRTRQPKASYLLKICFDVKYPLKPQAIEAEISTKVFLWHDTARINTSDNAFNFTTSLNEKKLQYCNDVDVILPEDGNYDEPIKYKIVSELVSNPLEDYEFQPSRVLLSDKSILQVEDYAWIANCAGVQCKPRLSLTIEDTMGEIYTIGTNKKESFTLTIKNTEELAYDACVLVYVQNVHVSRSPSTCGAVGNAFQCKPGKPLRTNASWIIEGFELEMTQLTNQLHSMKIEVLLFDHCKDKTASKYEPEVKEVLLRADPRGIEIKGECSIKDIIYITSSEMLSNVTKLYEHRYTIINDEKVIWENLQCQVELMNRPYFDYSLFKISIPGELSFPECKEVERTDEYIRQNCTIKRVEKRLKIMLPLKVLPNKLADYLDENKTLQFHTNFTLFFNDTSKTESVVTTVQKRDIEVPLWIIIGAGLLGLCILAIIILALRECGCLRRKHKTELQKLRKSVRRQTINRPAISNVQLPSGDDHTHAKSTTMQHRKNVKSYI